MAEIGQVHAERQKAEGRMQKTESTQKKEKAEIPDLTAKNASAFAKAMADRKNTKKGPRDHETTRPRGLFAIFVISAVKCLFAFICGE
jgi:hypothetical protein